MTARLERYQSKGLTFFKQTNRIMKAYTIGNKRLPKTWNYISREKTTKAEKVFARVIQRVFPDCKTARNTTVWPVNFHDNTQIIEILGFKIAVGKYSLRDNYYLFCFIGN